MQPYRIANFFFLKFYFNMAKNNLIRKDYWTDSHEGPLFKDLNTFLTSGKDLFYSLLDKTGPIIYAALKHCKSQNIVIFHGVKSK